jgi:hypothetical protein
MTHYYAARKGFDTICISRDLTPCLRAIAKALGKITSTVTVKEAMDAGYSIGGIYA